MYSEVFSTKIWEFTVFTRTYSYVLRSWTDCTSCEVQSVMYNMYSLHEPICNVICETKYGLKLDIYDWTDYGI